MGRGSSAGYNTALKNVVSGNFKYLAQYIGNREDDQKVEYYDYALFEGLNEKEIKEYGANRAKEACIALKKINIFSLESKVVKEIEIE